MREFKFRAWHPELKKMSPAFDFKELVYSYDTGDLIGYEDHEFLGRTVRKCAKEPERNPIIMQYTGRKDENGKEIYEGDIVLCENFLCAIVFENTEGDSDRYMNRHAAFFPKTIGTYGEYQLLMEWPKTEFLEIIGNIFENPEIIQFELKTKHPVVGGVLGTMYGLGVIRERKEL